MDIREKTLEKLLNRSQNMLEKNDYHFFFFSVMGNKVRIFPKVEWCVIF